MLPAAATHPADPTLAARALRRLARASLGALALLLALAAPGTALAWTHGTHSTLEHVAAHEHALELGAAEHHGEGRHHDAAHAHESNWCATAGDALVTLAPPGPAVAPASASPKAPSDLVQCAPRHGDSTAPAPSRDGRAASDPLSTPQQYPAPDHRPPSQP